MTKRNILAVLLISMITIAKGQQYDAQWALGYYESKLDFRNDTVHIDSLKTVEYFTFTNASICDENGVLLYYTNGISVCGVNDTLLNGNGLNPCAYTTAYEQNGLNIQQADIFIPQPSNNRYYYLFHFTGDSNARPSKLYYSLIDKDGNLGKGEVIEKNVIFFQGSLLRNGGMTACKHANGRDYWLVMAAFRINRYYKFLITPEGIQGPYTQDIGPDYPPPYDNAYSKFSQDGTKYATGAFVSLVTIMDFDRCSGEFSNPLTIFNNSATNPDTAISGAAAVEFSPDNRFLYISNNYTLRQYDLISGNIHDSVELFRENNTDTASWSGIDFLQTAPNGKIYCSTWNGGLPALHVINHPDLKGDSAGFVFGGQPTYSIASVNLPNLINYRLGPLIGSGCDTITSTTNLPQAEQLIRIQPNPANKFLYVEAGMQGNYLFELLTNTGQLIDTRTTPQVDMFDTSYLTAGTYLLRVTDKSTGKEIGTKQVVVAH